MQFDILDVKNLVTTFDPEQPTGDPFLDFRYEAHRAEYGHGNPYWRMFYHLCARYEPTMVVELGAWQCTCAAHMAAGSGGTVVTIDHHTDRIGETHPPGDDVNEGLCRDVARRYPGIYYIKGWTWDVWEEVRDLGKKVEILFIDSWHDYEHAMLDWNTYRPLLADPALVVCDDIIAHDGPVISGMVKFWNDVTWNSERFLLEDGPHNTVPMGFFKWTRS
jgi:predicted O-methyltransferase YrrM